MAGGRRVRLEAHVPIEELREMYLKEGDPRVKERLLAILHLQEGMTLKEVSAAVERSIRSIERWVKAWNEGGYDGLRPDFKGGPKPKLSDEEWDRILDEVEDKAMTLREIAVYVKDTGG